MKLRSLLFIAFSMLAIISFAQTSVTKITIKEEVYYITTKNVGYPITGLYKYESKGEPIVQLNEDGTGLFQNHGMSATKMVWGIECDEKGVAKKQEGPGGARYLLWYQIKEKHKGPTWESGEVDKWDAVELTVHFTDGKIDILRERFKEN